MVKPVIESPDYTIIIRAILLGRFSNRMLVFLKALKTKNQMGGD